MTDKQIHTELVKLIPREQIFTDHLSRLTKGTDAGLYRLIPKVVVQVNSEDEVIRLLNFCNKNKIGVTLRQPEPV